MGNMQAILEKTLKDVPRLILRDMVTKKLRGAGIDSTPNLIDRMLAHILSGNHELFRWEDGRDVDLEVILSISDTDATDAEAMIARLVASVPDIIADVSEHISKVVLKTLKKEWREEYALQRKEQRGFRTRLEKRWGKALGALRMLLTISREIGQETIKTTPLHLCHLRNVLIRLHVRACQVTSEIIVLLENGYADGAMARWRTLHEITIVIILVKDHGEPLAERYIAHRAIEAKSEKDYYARCHAQLGYQPIDHETCREIDEAHQQAIVTYGKEFGGPYGWAAGYVPKGGRPLRLGDLEAAAGRSALASHYKLASYNIHAGPHALFFRLGLIGEAKLLAGASNAGLLEPGQNTAISLALISIMVVGENPTLDDVVAMKLLQLLSREIPPLFADASRRLEADHRRHMRATRE
jgi:hypothetical protein